MFFGAGEVAELAYLYLQLTHMRLVGIVDERQNGRSFFEFRVADLDRLRRQDWDIVLLTRLDHIEKDMGYLLEQGFSPDRIATL